MSKNINRYLKKEAANKASAKLMLKLNVPTFNNQAIYIYILPLQFKFY